MAQPTTMTALGAAAADKFAVAEITSSPNDGNGGDDDSHNEDGGDDDDSGIEVLLVASKSSLSRDDSCMGA